MTDTFNKVGAVQKTGPVEYAVAPTKADVTTDDPAGVARGIYVGVTGDVVAVLAGTTTQVTFKGMVAGVWHPMRVKRVWTTGTTATDLLLGY